MSSPPSQLFELGKSGVPPRPLTLRRGDKGRQGASGTVYDLPGDPGKAIKIYHERERLKFEDKIRTMIKVRYHRPHTGYFDFAWPESIVVGGSGKFLGFKMPFLGSGWVDLESLMQAAEAELKYGIGDRERLTIATNLALAIRELHALKVYCVDLKPDNVRVNLSKGSVGIIDCDGMSVTDIASPSGRRFHADKSTPEFWAPENIGVKPQYFKDEETHDQFALATIIFMLLNRGIHPFQGVLLVDTPGAETTAGKIKNSLYPYGLGKGKINPIKGSLYPFWPDETKALFDKAFSTTTARPSAAQWFKYLTRLKSQVTPCNANPKYHIKHPIVGCPVCALKQSTPKSSPNRSTTAAPKVLHTPAHTTSPSSAPAAGFMMAASIVVCFLVAGYWFSTYDKPAIAVVAGPSVPSPNADKNKTNSEVGGATTRRTAPQVPPMGGPLVAPPPPSSSWPPPAPLDAPPISRPAPPPASPSLTFRVKSNHANNVALSFYSNRSRVWPGNGRSYLLNDWDTHTYNLGCQIGEKICYGAWVNGGPLSPYWGAGNGGKEACANCCFFCNNQDVGPITLEPRDAKSPTPTVTFKIKSNHPNIVHVEFYSDNRNVVWPGNGQVYVLNDYETKTIGLTCQAGENICYGAWVSGGNTSWGVGRNKQRRCSNCCSVCNGGEVGPLVLNP